MTLTNEDLLAISQLLDAKLQSELQPIKNDITTIAQRIDSLELQLKSSERTLKNEIRKSESLILDEVERVHEILDKHKEDTTKHTA